MSRKSKGINAERELIHKFWSQNIAAIRVAGSGSIKYPAPDVLAGNTKLALAIECKVSRSKSQYLTMEEINDLAKFSEIFNALPLIGVKFNNVNWYFFRLKDLNQTDKHYVITLEYAQKKGMLFNDIIKLTK
jgi:Holliday junction resolvase